MDTLNQTLFLWLNASGQPNAIAVAAASFFAQWLIWAIPMLIGFGWLRGQEHRRQSLLIITLAGLLGLLINQMISVVWFHPRPFMIGLGHSLIPHAADSSFPSDHLTLWWTVAFGFLLQPGTRIIGMVLALLGLPIAWARIYLGVHFPFDMFGSMVVAMASAWLILRTTAWYLKPLYQMVMRLHRLVFGELIP